MVAVQKVLLSGYAHLEGHADDGFRVDAIIGAGEAPLPGEEPQHDGEAEARGAPLAREEGELVRA